MDFLIYWLSFLYMQNFVKKIPWRLIFFVIIMLLQQICKLLQLIIELFTCVAISQDNDRLGCIPSLRRSLPFYSKWCAKKLQCATYWKNVKILLYLNVNRGLIIHYENIFKIYIIYSKIYLKYIQNTSLFHKKIF